MKNSYLLFFVLIATTSLIIAQPPNFYNMSYKIALPQQNMWYPPVWKSMGSSDSALYVVGNNSIDNIGICFIYYHNGGMKCMNINTTNILKGVQFLSTAIGFVWGGGELLKTVDGGDNWASVATNLPGTDKVQFIDENNAFCLAGNSIYKTQNGGISWTQISVPATVPITGFHFFDAQNGQISGGQSPPGYLYQTSDGGLGWDSIYSNSSSFVKFSYVNDSVGYLFGYSGMLGSVFKTIDKGMTWNVNTQNYTWGIISDIVSFNQQPAWIETGGTPGWVRVDGSVSQATSAFAVYSLNYNGSDIFYLLSDSGLFRYSTEGPLCQTVNFFSGVNPNTSNPSNSILPGKRVRFKVNVKNNLSSNLLTLSGKIRSTSPYISITDSIGTYNNVLSGASAWSADEFEMELASDIPDNYMSQFEMILEDQIQTGDPWISFFSFPVILSPFAVSFNIIDDDNIPDSNGDNDDIAEPGETIEIIPLADKISPHIFGNMEGYLFSPLSEINIWKDTMGSTGTVYNHYPYGVIDTLTQPSEDFVFTNNFTTTYNLLFSMVFTGNIKSFKVDGNYNGYINIDSTIMYRWDAGFDMNNGFQNPPNFVMEEKFITDGYVYPNPNKGVFNVSSPIAHSKIMVYNMLGEMIYLMVGNDLQKSLIPVDLSKYGSGVYHLQLITINGNSATVKMVVY